jgi:UDP-glucose-4-epimerase GalE
MRILVTGGAGYIGSHVCKRLAADGHEPIVYDNLSRGNVWAVKWGPLERGDLGDGARLREVIGRHRPAAVMHFAAYAYVGESNANPLLYYANNVGGSQVLLAAAAEAGPLPVVFSSTCATYGLPLSLPIGESHPQAPVNPYGFTKLVVERMLRDLDTAAGLRSATLRYFNAAGADPDGEIGEAHEPETHLIPLALAAARDGGAIEVFGTDYDTADGTCVRDYVHVMDIADAHVRALDYLLDRNPSCAFNLANAQGYSVRQVIDLAQSVAARPIRANSAARRPGDPPVLIGDASRARDMLSWRPAHSEIRNQIADAWRWMSKSKALRKSPQSLTR